MASSITPRASFTSGANGACEEAKLYTSFATARWSTGFILNGSCIRGLDNDVNDRERSEAGNPALKLRCTASTMRKLTQSFALYPSPSPGQHDTLFLSKASPSGSAMSPSSLSAAAVAQVWTAGLPYILSIMTEPDGKNQRSLSFPEDLRRGLAIASSAKRARTFHYTGDDEQEHLPREMWAVRGSRKTSLRCIAFLDKHLSRSASYTALYAYSRPILSSAVCLKALQDLATGLGASTRMLSLSQSSGVAKLIPQPQASGLR